MRRFPCWQAATSHEPGERSPDRDLRSHLLTGLLRELGDEPAQDWKRRARLLNKLDAPTRYPDALGDELPADVFGPEDRRLCRRLGSSDCIAQLGGRTTDLRLSRGVDQATTRLERARSAAPPTSPWTLLGEIARTSVAGLALAVGYAGLAWQPGSELLLLIELQLGWESLRNRRGVLRGRSGRAYADAHDLRQIGGAEDASQK